MSETIGEKLRLARETRGIALRDISEQTRISIRYLEAIETDDFQRLPGGIFNRSLFGRTPSLSAMTNITPWKTMRGPCGSGARQMMKDRKCTTRSFTLKTVVPIPVVAEDVDLGDLILAALSLAVWGGLNLQTPERAKTSPPALASA
jgi:hypothetical protein